MTIEGLHFLASGQVPHLDRVIYTSTDHGLSIRTDCYTLNTVCMTIEGLHFLASGQVPHLDHRIPASTDQGLSIRTDRDTRNTFCMTRESAKQCQFFDHE